MVKVVKYRNIGVVEDNYVENDYWDEHKYCGFELNNGKCIVYIYTINNFGDDSKGSEIECYYINSLDDKFQKGFLWKSEEVSKEEIKVIEDYYDNDSDFDSDEETDIVTV
mgnify:FL=1